MRSVCDICKKKFEVIREYSICPDCFYRKIMQHEIKEISNELKGISGIFKDFSMRAMKRKNADHKKELTIIQKELMNISLKIKEFYKKVKEENK